MEFKSAIDETTHLKYLEEEKTTHDVIGGQEYFEVFPKMHETMNKIEILKNSQHQVAKNNVWDSIKDEILEIRNTCDRVNLIDCLSQVEGNLVDKSALDINDKNMQQILYVGIFFRFALIAFIGMINDGPKQKKYKIVEKECQLIEYCIKMVDRYHLKYRSVMNVKTGHEYKFQHGAYYDISLLYQYKGPDSIEDAIKYRQLFVKSVMDEDNANDGKYVKYVNRAQSDLVSMQEFVKQYQEFNAKKRKVVDAPRFNTGGWWQDWAQKLGNDVCVIL